MLSASWTMMHGYFKMGNVSCRIVSDTSLFIYKICVSVVSNTCPDHIHTISVHYRIPSCSADEMHVLPQTHPRSPRNLIIWLSVGSTLDDIKLKWKTRRKNLKTRRILPWLLNFIWIWSVTWKVSREWLCFKHRVVFLDLGRPPSSLSSWASPPTYRWCQTNPDKHSSLDTLKRPKKGLRRTQITRNKPRPKIP